IPACDCGTGGPKCAFGSFRFRGVADDCVRAGGVSLTLLQSRPSNFADQRTLSGVPNFFNVVSNLPFLLVALWGLRALRRPLAFRESWERTAHAVLLGGVALTAIGSPY